jgi:hypothetical protein
MRVRGGWLLNGNRNGENLPFSAGNAVLSTTAAGILSSPAGHAIHFFLASWFQCRARRPMEKIGVYA